MAGVGISGFPALGQEARDDEEVVRILALFSYVGGVYYFNPSGVHVDVGQTVEWAGVRTRAVTAYHPSNENHELRIPEDAEPFDSRTMGSGDGRFRWTFKEEGTYDYYAPSHEYFGMVGRIVVGRPGGPGEKTPGYGNREGRAVMYASAAKLLEYLKSDRIVEEEVIRYPTDLLSHEFPWR